MIFSKDHKKEKLSKALLQNIKKRKDFLKKKKDK